MIIVILEIDLEKKRLEFDIQIKWNGLIEKLNE